MQKTSAKSPSRSAKSYTTVCESYAVAIAHQRCGNARTALSNGRSRNESACKSVFHPCRTTASVHAKTSPGSRSSARGSTTPEYGAINKNPTNAATAVRVPAMIAQTRDRLRRSQ